MLLYHSANSGCTALCISKYRKAAILSAHSHSLSDTKLPARRCPRISSVHWLALFREVFCTQRPKHKTAPARRRGRLGQRRID
jgi:hypothetical protein